MSDIALRPVDPVADLDLLCAWVHTPRAAFWGMTDLSRDDVAEIYTYIDEQDHLTAWIIEIDGVAVGLFQTYDPWVDDIGEHYERRDGDLGVHLLLAEAPARVGRTTEIGMFLLRWVVRQHGARRLVGEPDVANTRSIERFTSLGFERGPVIAMPEKVAQFLFLPISSVSPSSSHS